MGSEPVTGACGHVLSCGIGSHSEKEGACLSVRSMLSPSRHPREKSDAGQPQDEQLSVGVLCPPRRPSVCHVPPLLVISE